MSFPQQPVTIPHTEQFLVTSNVIGDQFKISVALPKNYMAVENSYPVVYLLDANIFFGMVAETAWLLQYGGEIPEIVLVGIGYPDDSQHLDLRTRDYTPTANNLPGMAGGADQFLDFLVQELLPYLQEHFRIDPEDSTLVGDSYGGLFALYTLFKQPTLFKRYIIGSPSIYWDNNIMFEYESTYAASHSDLPVTIFLSAGALEEIYEPEFAAMVDNVKRMNHVLNSRGYPRLKLISHIFEDETHLSVIPSTMSRGLRAVFAG